MTYLKSLKKYFKFDNFRDKQKDIIDAILNKQDVCGILFTGAGKSLCYQFPAVYTKKISIVISPLIALINDQMAHLNKLKIPAIALNGTVSNKLTLQREILKNKYRVVYSTPEYLMNQESFLEELVDKDLVTLFGIDESHCISSWGNDFRPAYKNLNRLKELFPNVPVLALTATATQKVQEDICKTLNLKSPKVVKTTFDRPNLLLKVVPKSAHPINDLIPLLKDPNERTIIYCQTRKSTEFIAELLNNSNIKADSYHAGMSSISREIAHNDFESGEIQVLAASVAYGLGVDLVIRNVIHYGPPGDIETYYQAIGRAGRDHKPSKCILLFKPTDFSTNDYFTNQIDNRTYRKHRLELSTAMKSFVYSSECRRKTILEYFGEEYSVDNCKNCDNCLVNKSQEAEDLTKEAKLLMNVIKETGDTYGATKIVNILRGSKSKSVKYCMDYKSYNSGSHLSEKWWKVFIRMIITKKFIKEKSVPHGYGCTLSRTKEGKGWMKKEDNKLMLAIPNISSTNTPVISNIIKNTKNTKKSSNMNDTIYKTYDMFQNQKLTLVEVAEKREIQLKTVEEHIVKAYERDYEVDLKRLKFNDKIYKIIKKIIDTTQDTLLRTIKKKLPDNISYLQIKLALQRINKEKTHETTSQTKII